jgi:hypothetical protein
MTMTWLLLATLALLPGAPHAAAHAVSSCADDSAELGFVSYHVQLSYWGALCVLQRDGRAPDWDPVECTDIGGHVAAAECVTPITPWVATRGAIE